MTDYLQLLEHSYDMQAQNSMGCPPDSRLDFLGDYIFRFQTDDSEMSAKFARLALDVCQAITDGKTFEYIEDKGRYAIYLLLLNTTFFADRHSCGGSIRGAWWETQPAQKLFSCALYVGDEQVTDWEFTPEEWEAFVRAMIAFAAQDNATTHITTHPGEPPCPR